MENYKNYIKKFDFKKIAGSSPDLSESDRNFFKSLTKSVEESQHDFFDYVEQNTIKEYSRSVSVNNIHTLMLRGDNLINPEGFYSMLDADENNENIVFVDCEISDISSYEGKHYAIIDGKEEREITLERTNIFIEKENIIFELFRFYNINMPCIYSPYARRAFVITDENINLKRNRIEFKDKKIFTGKLLWNIEITPASRLSRYKEVTVNGQNFIRFENSGKDDFIIIDSSDSGECFVKNSTERYIDIDVKSFETFSPEYFRVTIKNIITERKNKFVNSVNNNIIAPERIRTRADVGLAVNKYYPFPDEYKGFFMKTNNNTVKDYVSGYKYNYTGSLSVGLANKNYCYLKFENQNSDIFFEDRINHFIAFMRYNYPEFYWVGEK